MTTATTKRTKECTIVINDKEHTFESKTKAIQSCLVSGIKKSEIAKLTASHYSFVVSIEKKMIFDASDEGKTILAKKEADKAAKAEAKLQAEKEKEERKRLRLEQAAERKAQKEADAARKAAKKKDKTTDLTGVGASLGITPIDLGSDEDDILADYDMSVDLEGEVPADIAAQMKEDGLIESDESEDEDEIEITEE